MAEPWEKQPGETPKSFKAFELYRDLGYNRSVSKVAAALGKRTTTYLYEWSTRFNWVQRTHDWDNHQSLLRINAQNEAFKNISEKQLRQAGAFRDILNLPITVFAKKLKKNEHGKIQALEDLESLSTLQLFELINDTIRSFDTLVKVERLALGIPTEIHKSDTTVNIENQNLFSGDKIAKDKKSTELLTKLLNAVSSNGKPDNNGSLRNQGSLPTAEASDSDK